MPSGKRALMSAQRAVDAGAAGARRNQAVDQEAWKFGDEEPCGPETHRERAVVKLLFAITLAISYK